MRTRSILILQIILIPFLVSCHSTRHLSKSSPVQSNPSVAAFTAAEQSYIETYRNIAVSEMKRTGIPASITLAQGMIESDNGKSPLARDANNHFGIKCHSDWTGPKVYYHDDGRDECFRKYSRAEDSFHDHSEFLRTVPRYKFLFDISVTDYKSWAQGLRKAGYATNPEYANMLIRTIEEKNLAFYDTGYKPGETLRPEELPVTVKQPVPKTDSGKNTVVPTPINDKTMVISLTPRVKENNRLKYIIIKDGDTREKLEEEFQLLHWELPRYNDMEGNFRLVPGAMLYLQAKKDKAEQGYETYTATDGDTMYLIAQKFGIKLKTLYRMNRMEEKLEPQPGSIIWLRSIKPAN